MKQYKLKNKSTNEEVLCTKVVVDGFDYYINDKQPVKGWYYDSFINKIKNTNGAEYGVNDITKNIVCCNNPSIDISKVIDEVEELANTLYPDTNIKELAKLSVHIRPSMKKQYNRKLAWIKGYNTHASTHTLSNDEVVELLNFLSKNYQSHTDNTWRKLKQSEFRTSKELLQLFKEQLPKTIYYEYTKTIQEKRKTINKN